MQTVLVVLCIVFAGFVLIAKSEWIRFAGTLLIRVSDASAAAKSSWKGTKPTNPAATRRQIVRRDENSEQEQLADDVTSALMNLGASAARAKKATEAAIANGNQGFNSIFNAALQLTR